MTLLDIRLLATRLGIALSHETEARLIERYGSAKQKAHLALYKADHCTEEPDTWCDFVSQYLSLFGLAAISVRPGAGNAFDRFGVETARPVTDDRKVSVLIAAYNSADTIGWAVRSILNQTWKNLEVLVVDDASTDDTWSLACELARQDPRVSVLRNSRNVGPFVSRNRAIPLVSGHFITGHDADDWAHPQRIERQIERIDATPTAVGIASMMLRMDNTLRFRHLRDPNNRIVDRPANLHPVSSLYRMDAFRRSLGHWDSVRFSGDGELLKRAQKVFGTRILPALVSNLSLDRPSSIMNDPVHGRRSGRRKLSPTRVSYRKSYAKWHAGLDAGTAYMPFPLYERRFEAPSPMIVDLETVQELL
jgi:glycosyltransferase involved in cell wall biosynthesis